MLHCEAVSCYAENMENNETVETVYIVRSSFGGAIYGVCRDRAVACEVTAAGRAADVSVRARLAGDSKKGTPTLTVWVVDEIATTARDDQIN